MRSAIIFMCIALAAVSVGNAGIYTDTFDGGANPSGWEYAAADNALEAAGGNPDGWLHGTGWGFNYPELRTTTGATTPFHGDYRAAGVDGIGFDLSTLDAPTWAMDGQNGFTGILMLSGSGMAASKSLGVNMLDSHAGWHSFNVSIPSADTSTIPAGWVDSFGGLDWNTLITNVEQVQILYLDGFGGVGMNFELGVDNITLTPEPGSLALVALSALGLIRRR